MVLQHVVKSLYFLGKVEIVSLHVFELTFILTVATYVTLQLRYYMFEFLILSDLRTTSVLYGLFLFLNVFKVTDCLLQVVVATLPVFYLS